jgi:hypothetical protein
MSVHLSFMAEAYIGNRELILAIKRLFDEAFDDWSLILEADQPPMKRWTDFLDTAAWLEKEGIRFLLDGLQHSMPRGARDYELLVSSQLAQLREAAPKSWLGLRAYTPLDTRLSAPEYFVEAFEYCNREQLAVHVVLHRHAFFAEGWREALLHYKTDNWAVLHEGMEGNYLFEDSADYLAEFAKEQSLRHWGQSLVAHQVELRWETARLDIETWLSVELAEGASAFHFVPLSAFLTGDELKPLPTDLHSWPKLDFEKLYKPGSELHLSPLGKVLASKKVQRTRTNSRQD